MRGSKAAKAVYLSSSETIVGRKMDVKKEGSNAGSGKISWRP